MHALINALVELRIENDYVALKVPGPIFDQDNDAFILWATNAGYLEDYEDELPENPKKDSGDRTNEDRDRTDGDRDKTDVEGDGPDEDSDGSDEDEDEPDENGNGPDENGNGDQVVAIRT